MVEKGVDSVYRESTPGSRYLVDSLDPGGPTFCSWRANLHFHKNTGGHKKKSDIIIYNLFNT